MNADFARTLALLRQERGISQRQAAQALGISQALLYHYENGVREPGLNFVVKACDYYHVSADFLLGRTLNRDGATILDAEALCDTCEEQDSGLKGTAMATLSKKLIVNSVGVLFDLLGRLGNKKAIKAAANYLSTGLYTLYRHLRQASPDGNDGFFSISREHFMAGLPRADMILTEMEYTTALYGQRKEPEQFPEMSHDALTNAYPGAYQSLLQIVHVCGERLNREMADHVEQ